MPIKDLKDTCLLWRGYKEAYIPDMNYKMVFRIDGNDVYVVGLLTARDGHYGVN